MMKKPIWSSKSVIWRIRKLETSRSLLFFSCMCKVCKFFNRFFSLSLLSCIAHYEHLHTNLLFFCACARAYAHDSVLFLKKIPTKTLWMTVLVKRLSSLSSLVFFSSFSVFHRLICECMRRKRVRILHYVALSFGLFLLYSLLLLLLLPALSSFVIICTELIH